MKKNIITILFLSIVGAQGINSNINSFNTNVVLRPSESNIEVITFVEIFNRNLQFLKKDINFESSFELNISLISKDGDRIDEKSFSETIKVENFSQTVSRANPKLIITSFNIPLQEFNVVFSLKDMDTKLTGKKEKEFFKKNLPSGQYSKIFEPIFVKNMKGSWRFGIDKYPINIKKVEAKDNKIEFYQYYIVEEGDYSLDVSLISDKKIVWSKFYEDETNENYDYKLLQIPIEGIDTSDLRVKIQVSQNGNVSSKSFPIEIKNDYLMLSSIKNVSSALDQMNYILDSEERRELRNLKGSDKEKFFKKVWAKRDPDVTTKEN